MSRRRQQQLPLLSASIRSSLTALRRIQETDATPRPTTPHHTQHTTPPHHQNDHSDGPCDICGSSLHDPTECPDHDVIYDDPTGPPRPRRATEPRPGRYDQLAIPRAIAASLLTSATHLYNLYATDTVATVSFAHTHPTRSTYEQTVLTAADELLRQRPRPTGDMARKMHPSSYPTLQLHFPIDLPYTFPEFANDVANAIETEIHGHPSRPQSQTMTNSKRNHSQIGKP